MQEINELLSGELDDTADDAVEQELQDIVNSLEDNEVKLDDLPSVPSEEPTGRAEIKIKKEAKIPALA